MEHFYYYLTGEHVKDNELKDYAEEIDLLSQNIVENPLDRSALKKRAFAYCMLQNYEDALQDITAALNVDHNDYSALNTKGMILFALEQDEEAIAYYSLAISTIPQNDVIFCNRAVAFLRQEKHWLALADVNTALNFNPNSSAAYWYRGQIHQDLKSNDEAREDFTKAVELGMELAQSSLDELDEESK